MRVWVSAGASRIHVCAQQVPVTAAPGFKGWRFLIEATPASQPPSPSALAAEGVFYLDVASLEGLG